MITVERIKFNNTGCTPTKRIVFIAKDIEEAHKALELLEDAETNRQIGYRVREISVPTALAQLMEDLDLDAK